MTCQFSRRTAITAIDAAQVRGIKAAIKDAAGAAMDRSNPEAAKQLVLLCKGMKLDIAVS